MKNLTALIAAAALLGSTAYVSAVYLPQSGISSTSSVQLAQAKMDDKGKKDDKMKKDDKGKKDDKMKKDDKSKK